MPTAGAQQAEAGCRGRPRASQPGDMRVQSGRASRRRQLSGWTGLSGTAPALPPPHSAQLAPRSTLTTPGVCCPPLCPPWLSGARPVGPQHADLGPILWLSSRSLYQLCPWPRAPGVHTQGPWAEGLHTQVLTAPCQSHCPHYTVTPGPRTGCWVEALSLKVTCWKSARPLPNLL